LLTLRLLLAARDGRDQALAERLDDEARLACSRLGAGSRAIGLIRLEPDPFAAQYPTPRAFEAVLAVDLPDTDIDAHPERLIDVARGTDERLGELIQPDLSGALVAHHRRVAGGEGPVRFIYLMRHKAGHTTQTFQQHWGGPHAEFGRQTKGINGYDQLHVDPAAARAAARAAGFGIHQIDGVPELHMESVDEFIAAAVGSETGNAAIEDEKSFVDARNSVGFVCREVTRHEGERR
jgi:hypothetical protein